jgi:hypothetical protein
MLLCKSHVSEDSLDDLHVEGLLVLIEGHKVKHALGVEVGLIQSQGLNIHVADLLVRVLCVLLASSILV